MNKKRLHIGLLMLVILIAVAPLFWYGNRAEFGGSDDAGSEMISRIRGEEYEPWFEPVLESALGAELPGEVESLFFCVQVGLGCSVLFFLLGRYYERYRLTHEEK